MQPNKTQKQGVAKATLANHQNLKIGCAILTAYFNTKPRAQMLMSMDLTRNVFINGYSYSFNVYKH